VSSAKELEVNLNEKTKSAEVFVPDDQLSLAIGRDGQNVRLAAKLTGWKIDIKGKGVPAVKETLQGDSGNISDKKPAPPAGKQATSEVKAPKEKKEEKAATEQAAATPQAVPAEPEVAQKKVIPADSKKE
jgi:transcription antitermination factor NusA-like protein